MNLQLDHFSDDYTTNQKPREGLKRLSALFSSVLRAVWLSFVVTLISPLLGSCVCGRSFSVCAPRSGPPTVQRVLQQACCLERKFMDALRAIFSVSRGGGDSASGTRTEVPKLALAFKRSCFALDFSMRLLGCGYHQTKQRSINHTLKQLKRERGDTQRKFARAKEQLRKQSGRTPNCLFGSCSQNPKTQARHPTTVVDGSHNVSRWMTWLPISLKNAAKCDKWYQLQNLSITESLNANGAWKEALWAQLQACHVSVSNKNQKHPLFLFLTRE